MKAVVDVSASKVMDGEIAYFDADQWQGKTARVSIVCGNCGGESDGIAIDCRGATDPRFVPLVLGKCPKCGREIYAGVFFYAYEVVKNSETARFNYHIRRRQLLALEIDCPDCQEVSYPIFISCAEPGIHPRTSLCKGCQKVLSATIELIH